MIAIAATILPPGYPAYIGAYVAMLAAIIALLVFGWRERSTLTHPTSLAILGSIALVSAVVPFVYQSSQDLLAPVLQLPMLTAVALAMLARPAGWVPGPALFAGICLLASLIALLGGGYEHLVLGLYRPGLGNNPIHYASLAAMSGSLALVGVVAARSPWRYVFLLGPVFGLGCAVIADSRGPMLGSLITSGIGVLILTLWLWREKLFRLGVLVILALALGAAAYLVGSGNARVGSVFQSGLNIFRFTGGSDDIRAALYFSALHILETSPLVGVGLGQIMETAQTLFPAQRQVFILENLHADWANFAAMAGYPGLLAYLMLLAAPLLILLDRHARQDQPIVLGAVLLTTGQMVLGISNSMFGVLPQTVLYAVALGYLLVRARRLTLQTTASKAPPIGKAQRTR